MLEINSFTNEVLKDISFSLKKNEDLIILGKNGAGKSTLAKVLSNLIENDKVKLNATSITKLDDLTRAKLINYIPPNFEIFDEYITLKEYLELSFIQEVNYKEINKIVKLLGLEKLKNKHCINFSSGEKQLLLLASAIIHNAQITIFDELSANLDINRLKEVFDIFNSNLLKQKIIITHNLDLAYALKYKILYLDKGTIKFFGSSEEFFENSKLKEFYNNSIIKTNNHLVVNL